MIYAINRRTKEHRITEPGKVYENLAWRFVESDAEGWIPWQGGECPLPNDAWCEVVMRDGEKMQGWQSRSCWVWGRYGSRDDIIAYRPILEAEPGAPRCKYCDGTGDVHSPDGEWRGECTVCNPDATEWDGEGLPPVGCECDAVWLELPDRGSRDFEPVTVKGVFASANGRTKIWFSTLADEDIVMREGDCQFRPIRSEEDRAVEEMLSLDCEPHEGMLSRTDFCRELYRAGYRKEPT